MRDGVGWGVEGDAFRTALKRKEGGKMGAGWGCGLSRSERSIMDTCW
jgi:hypothetical protein